MTSPIERWQAKVAAWLHDPPEKALVLMREPGVGHEGRTVRVLREHLFPDGVPSAIEDARKQADRWASAADRLQLPKEPLVVQFARDPVFVHPIGKGQRLKVREGFKDLAPKELAAAATAWLEALVGEGAPGGDEAAWRRMFLRLWRLAPEVPPPRVEGLPEVARRVADLGLLWRMLPADTRTPNHTIWEHLRLSSAFAGAMVGGGRPALLAVALGPVQGFIERGRSTSDLWAGSHLLSRMAWEALRVLCEEVGPDAVIFPDLHGVPIVDAWLCKEARPRGEEAGALWDALWDVFGRAWRNRTSDANPLFAATLPNRLLAVVPHDMAPALAERITSRVRAWVRERAEAAWEELLETAGLRDEGAETERAYGQKQIAAQLAGFPEVHWASVPFPEARADGKVGDVAPLEELLCCFHADGGRGPFFDGETWKHLQGKVAIENLGFYEPNPGVTYPAVFEAINAVVAADKALRTFEQRSDADRHRDSLAGDAAALGKDPEAVWDAVAQRRPAWAREGERLGALGALKRLWPALFVAEVREFVGDEKDDMERYVVSTHAMALSTTLDDLAGGGQARASALAKLKETVDATRHALEDRGIREKAWRRRVALPQKLHVELGKMKNGEDAKVLRDAAALADFLSDADDALAEVRGRFDKGWRQAVGHPPEKYYALLLMDGDEMGRWLSERGGCDRVPRYRDTLHSAIREALRGREAYLDWPVAVSPAYHVTLSAALTGFSTFTAPRIVEQRHLGKVLYAGGDDLMAMCATSSLLSTMVELRCAYSGVRFPAWLGAAEEGFSVPGVGLDAGLHLKLENGFVMEWEGQAERKRARARVRRAMGAQATASMGVVIAHSMTPLRLVLDEVRRAEQAAKAAGRDAFTISLFKRGGGITRLSAGWGVTGDENPSVLQAVDAVRRAVAGGMSRRAAYISATWLQGFPAGPEDLGDEAYHAMLEKNLNHQFRRQGLDAATADDLAQTLAGAALAELRRRVERAIGHPSVPAFLADVLTVGEFLGRVTRTARKGTGP